MADISLPTPGQKPWSLNPAILAMNAELNGRLSEAGLQSTIGAQTFLTPIQFGAKANGSGDDLGAINAAMSAALTAGVGVHFPGGKYRVSAPIVQPNIDVQFGPGVEIVASQAMPYLWRIGTADSKARGRVLAGLRTVLNCDNKALIGVWMSRFNSTSISSVTVKNTAGDGFDLGDSSAPAGSLYEAVLSHCNVERDQSLSVVPGSVGLRVRSNVTDSDFDQIILIGAETGVITDGWSSRFIRIHPWGYSGKLPVTCFRDNGSFNTWAECYADSPSAYGWHTTGQFTQFLGCTVYCNTFVADNTVIGIRNENASPQHTFFGLQLIGSSGHRIASDFGGSGGTIGCTILGKRTSNIVAQQVDRDTFVGTANFRGNLGLIGDTNSFYIAGASGTQYINAQSGTKAVTVTNGGSLVGRSGNFADLKFKLDADFGGIRSGSYTTATRPSAATLGPGTRIYDSDLRKPVWSDGTTWRDATGTAV